IKKEKESITCDADELELYLALKDHAWIGSKSSIVQEIKEGVVCQTVKGLIQKGMELDPADTIGACFVGEEEELKPEIGTRQIHVLVVVPEGARSVNESEMELSTVDLPLKQDIAKYAEPPIKKAKITQLDVVFQGPVGAEFYSVPMETISVYGKLSGLLSTENAQLCLLYGPRQFGKTTIGYRIQQLLAVDSSVLVIYHSASENSVKTEKAFWMALGKICGEDASTPEDVMDIVIRRKQRLFLILDEMDAMFANRDLTSNFMDILRGWMTSPYFRGFLGIGSYDLPVQFMCYLQNRTFFS
ncbi:hypothetical protein AeNC1_017567, partial [Aphanomyces euteiches]